MKEKILVIGNYEDAMYHPLAGVDAELHDMFPEKELICTDDTGMLLQLEAQGFAGVISYLDIWDGKLAEEEAQALATFVEGGGALLLLHNGISIQSDARLEAMMGGRFLMHPPMEMITFEVKKHLITKGCDGFSMEEEPYQFALLPDDKEVFLTYWYREKEYIAGWSKEIGKGRLVFITPGHTPEKFKEPSYVKLIKRSMEWCLRKS